MTDEGVAGEPAAPGPSSRKAGWYRDRKTGQRRFWNGVAWADLSDAITPFTVEPAPAAPAPARASAVPGKGIDRRDKIFGSSVAVVALILAILLVIGLVNSGSTPVSTNDTTASPSSDADFPTLPSVTTTSPFESTTTSASTTVPESPGGPSPTVTRAGVSPPPVTSPEVPNPAGNVAIIGDSITVLAASNLAHALHQYNVTFDSVSGTTMAAHLQKIEAIESDGQPRDWVIELGTNDALPERSNPNWASDFANEVAALQTQRCVVFLTVNPLFGSIALGINGAIAGAVATHPNFHSLDWGDIEFRKPQWLDSDGIHPSKSGVVEMTKLDHQAIRDCQGD
jgi:lysophospholipase L1-like esterase